MTGLSDWNDLHVSAGLPEVRRQVHAAIERTREARRFSIVEEAPDEPAIYPNDELAPASVGVEITRHDWQELLQRNDKGTLLPHASNVITILKHHPLAAGLVSFNEFSLVTEKLAAPPWGGVLGEWSDSDDLRLMYWLSQQLHLNVKPDTVAQAVKKVADDSPYHPVRRYLNGLRWDGRGRLTHWLYSYLGVDLSQYSMAVSLKWMVSAVARVMRPGCKADGVMILYGSQGRGKSTALKILSDPWFIDTPLPIGQKDAYEMIRGCWISELGELDSLNKVEATSAKTFFSSSADRYRPSYGRHAITAPRQCVFAGSTNHFVHLKDPTGNRRFWSVSVGNIDLDALARDKDQLWAEAFECFQERMPWHVDGSERAPFEEEQEKHRLSDPFEEEIVTWLDAANSALKNDFTSGEILRDCLKVPAERLTPQLQSRVVAILERLGFARVRPRSAVNGKRSGYVYRRPSASGSEG